MERPTYDEAITRQNDAYAAEVIEKHKDRPKTADALMKALSTAFIMGAGGHEGSFDAALVLEYGGMAVLVESLGIAHIVTDVSEPVDSQVFDDAVRAAVDFGAAYDDLEDEIPKNAIREPIDGDNPFDGPLTGKFLIRPGEQRTNWLDEE